MSTRACLGLAIFVTLGAGCSSTVAPTDDAGIVPDAGENDGAAALDADQDAGGLDAGGPDSGPQPCDTEGAHEMVRCGTCASLERECRSGVWVAVSECVEFEWAVCTPGEVDDRYGVGNCMHERRECNSACAWYPWLVITPAGECAPGARVCEPPEDYICTADCRRIDNPDC
jgi:hypothetical protein